MREASAIAPPPILIIDGKKMSMGMVYPGFASWESVLRNGTGVP
jgi:hypothetical protein